MEILISDSNQDLIKQCDDKEKSENCTINKYLNNIIKNEGYINYKVYKRIISTGGASYFSILRQVDIKGDTAEGPKETNLFFKLKIPNYDQDHLTNLTTMFSKEAYIYNKLNKIFNSLQEEAGVPAHDRYKMVKSYVETDENAIVLENLAKKGYKIPNRLEVMPLKFMELSIMQLAKFHGLSFVINKKMPNYIEKATELFKYPVLYDDDWQAFVKNICKQEIDYLDSYFQTKIANTVPKLIEKFPKYLSGELGSVKCLCHGDYRPSNILVKEEEGELIDIIPLDYQMLFCGSPVTDFIYLITSSTDRQFRKDHLDNLKDLYHESLKKFLEYFDIEVESVYKKKQFEQDLKDYSDYGLFVAMNYFPFYFVEEDVPDFEKDNIVDVRVNLGPIFRERMEGVVQDFVDEGYL